MIKRLSAIAVFIITMLSITLVVSAASETKDIFTLDSTYNMAVSILFDKEMPVVSFTAPDGTIFNDSSLRSDSGEDWVQYYIPKAMPGTWQITYDKLSNTRFDVHYSSYMNAISISEFTIGTVNQGYIPAKFLVQSEEAGAYQYQIYAVITDDNGAVVGEKLLTEGSANPGEIVERDISIRDLQNYSEYKLRLDVWQKEGVEESYDSSIAENSFSVSGGSSYESIEDFRTEVNLTEGVITIDWQEWADYGVDYIVAVFDESVSKTEPIYFREIAGGETHATALFDPASTDSLRVDLTSRRGPTLSETKSKTLKVDTGVKFSWTEDQLGNSQQEVVSYDTPQNIMAEVTVNEKTGKVNLSGTGEFSLELAENYNEIYIRYTLDDPNTIYLLYFEKVVDNIPPILRLPENKSAIRVDDAEYVLAGVTEPNAVVNVGGEEVSVNQDGTFVHKIGLKYGENIIPVTATDAAGNITAQDIIIIRSSQAMAASTNDNGFWGKALRYLPMILSFIGSVILIALGYILTKIYDKNKEISKPFAVVSLLRNVFLVLSILSTLATGFMVYKYFTINSIINSEKMFEAANDSITEAFKLMEDFALYKKWLVKGIIVTLITLALFVGCMYMARMLKKRVTEQDHQVDHDRKEDTVQKPEESSPKTLSCPSCGAGYDEPVKFCGKCGTKLDL